VSESPDHRHPFLPPAPVHTDDPDQPIPQPDDPSIGDVDEHHASTSRLSPGARAFADWVLVVGIALLVAVLVRTFVLAHFVVDGTSMATTLDTGDRVFVNKLSYRLHDPNRGDVVVLHQISGSAERDLIKRVIGLPGEVVQVVSCEVRIDGRLLIEPYLDPAVVTPGRCGGDTEPTLVPPDHVFVMGDNRAGSQDSRALGPIPEDELVGRAFVVFWPRGNWQWL
jgi:signal peptidase I